MRSRVWLAWSILLLVGCASDDPERVTGGGGIEIPNGIDMSVVDSTGKPVAGARLQVVAGDDWASLVSAGASPVLDSAVTDAAGRVRIPKCEGTCWVEVVSGSVGARAAIVDGASLTLAMSGMTTVSGQIPASAPKVSRMRLCGTDRVATVDGTGRFDLRGVIRGRYSLVAEGVVGKGPLPAGAAVVGYTGVEAVQVAIDTSGVLLDDFTDGDVVWSLGNMFGASYWWLDASGPTEDVFGISTMAQGIHDSAGSRWLGVVVDTTAAKFTWANFGLDLGVPTRRLPLMDRLTAVRFRARGAGNWTLILNRDSSGVSADSKLVLPVASDWTSFRFPVSAFAPVVPRGWRLRNFVFETQEPGRLEIDDVVLEGVGLQDWLQH